MKKLLFLWSILLITIFAACSKDDDKLGHKFPLTDYSLKGTSCTWKPFEEKKVFVINSESELVNFIVGEIADIPKIDFEKNTLLLLSGWSGGKVINTQLELTKNTDFKFLLSVDINLEDSYVLGNWNISVITSKLDEEVDVNISVNEYFKK